MNARDVIPGDHVGMWLENGRYVQGTVRMSVDKGSGEWLIGFVPSSVPGWLLEESSGCVRVPQEWPVTLI